MDPHPYFLQRGPRPDDTLRGQFAELVDSCVNFGSHCFAWVLDVAPAPQHRITAALMLRQFLACVDGSSALIRAGSPESLKVVLRAVFEAYLNLMYLVEDAPERRSLCYGVATRHRFIGILKRRDPTTDEGRRLAEVRARDTSGAAVPIQMATGIPTVEEIQAELASEDFREVEAEWQRTRKGRRWPKWYSLFDGPKNLEELADHLRRGYLYELLYRDWSGVTHAESVLQHFSSPKPGLGAIPSLREADEIQLLTSISVTLALRCITELIARVIPAHLGEMGTWYRAEVQSGYAVVASETQLIRIERRIEGTDEK